MLKLYFSSVVDVLVSLVCFPRMYQGQIYSSNDTTTLGIESSKVLLNTGLSHCDQAARYPPFSVIE